LWSLVVVLADQQEPVLEVVVLVDLELELDSL